MTAALLLPIRVQFTLYTVQPVSMVEQSLPAQQPHGFPKTYIFVSVRTTTNNSSGNSVFTALQMNTNTQQRLFPCTHGIEQGQEAIAGLFVRPLSKQAFDKKKSQKTPMKEREKAKSE